MNDEPKDGGQAFPQPVTVGPNDDMYPAYPGMTLRDWFAGQALAGICSDGAALRRFQEAGLQASEVAAQSAYAAADAMLAARQKGGA